ncbi:MAG TPA: TetR/AcrR family transcriptional regulator C-terminal domain-containing protein [Coriobacteriia bacterium]|nr:TetR/AcrR family transcriptional regulator C-terminal domain-containing protein [Coriobacteriia bacterium]
MVARKANTPTLTREQIVAAAIAIVDREGLEALSMRKLAAELGVGAMSLYYHVPDKSSLYDLILEAVMSEMDLTGDDPSASAEARMLSLGYALRTALLAHPHAVPIALSRSLHTPGQLRPVEKLLEVMFDLGLTATDAVSAVDVVGQYIFGTTMAYANYLADSERPEESKAAERTVGEITPDEFPNLIRASQEAGFTGWDENFDRGLRALVRGVVLDRIQP